MVRVGSLQYYIRPVRSFDEFALQIEGHIQTARDYKIQVLVFPEYHSVQLLSLVDVKAPLTHQIRALAEQETRILELMSALAQKYKITVVGGSIPAYSDDKSKLLNKCYVFATDGSFSAQAKLHMTRFEKEEWLISSGQGLKIFETEHGRFAVAICYDVEFPEVARTAARMGAHFLVVPSCTDDRQGYLRVRYCAQARAIENQMYVVQSCTVGSLPNIPAAAL
jgi:predicted amidohydrolase